jgi:hypothetical protein
MAFIRKALFIATVGLLGLVFKDDSKDKRPAKAAEKRARPAKAAKKRARPATAAGKRARPVKQTKVKRPTPQAARRRKKATRTSTIARTSAPRDAATRELEHLANLHARGALTSEEFAAAKAKILGAGLKPPESFRDPAGFPAVEANIAAARQLSDRAADDRAAPVAPAGID